VVVHGDAELVTDAREKTRVLGALVDRVGTGRSAQCRPPTAKELAATSVLAIDLTAETSDVALKARTGGPADDEADLGLTYWAGVVPVRLATGTPQPECDLPPSRTASLPRSGRTRGAHADLRRANAQDAGDR